ncbi:ABC transporter substrate-binding protein [Jannaschia sp. LMIT008]|uniref:ABC transporter substrate-binding protein n=1 Tax=Jannaschia maritima TaxID=3032585 RepID=UPI002810E9E5|nr:ABC transporter substrate-binding protein [Jannaschia sp. LMIT008]
MSERVLRGLGWGHRRATAPMDAAARAFATDHGVRVEWDVQPLSGFESALGPDLAARYDLVVFDHPFCGAIARDGLLRPLDPDALAPGGLRDDGFIGRSLESYRHDGWLWGLPMDGATQTAIWRPDLIDAPPDGWDAVLACGARERAAGRALGFAAKAPHGFLALLALCANLGAPLAESPSVDIPIDETVLREAMDRLRAIWNLSDGRGIDWDAIDLHEAMSRADDPAPIAYAPLAYHYLTYAEDDTPRRLRFADFAGPGADPAAGTVLGGAGLGITQRCRDVEAATAFLRTLVSGPSQVALVCDHHGQPAAVGAWDDGPSDAPYGGAREATRRSMTRASLRPRFPGYIPFQHACGLATARWLAGDVTDAALASDIAHQWRRATGTEEPPRPGTDLS